MSHGHRLKPEIGTHLTEEFCSGEQQIDPELFLDESDIGRDIDWELVSNLIDRAMDDFAEDRAGSDGWLAPRLHAALRLTRSEAADRFMWAWLTVVEHDDYVRWRWPGRVSSDGDGSSGTPKKRFFGNERDNAIARLWWGAELFRNGPDYGPAEAAFAMQDIPNTWMILDAIHNRAAAQAALRVSEGLNSKELNRLAKALNHVLTTVQLDAVAPQPNADIEALEEWLSEIPSPESLEGPDLPNGPPDPVVEEDAIMRVAQLLSEVAEMIGLPVATGTSSIDPDS